MMDWILHSEFAIPAPISHMYANAINSSNNQPLKSPIYSQDPQH